MKLTPREPTPEMAVAGSIALRLTSFADLDATIEEAAAVWRAMHEAAPSVPSVEQELLEALEQAYPYLVLYGSTSAPAAQIVKRAIARAKGE